MEKSQETRLYSENRELHFSRNGTRRTKILTIASGWSKVVTCLSGKIKTKKTTVRKSILRSSDTCYKSQATKWTIATSISYYKLSWLEVIQIHKYRMIIFNSIRRSFNAQQTLIYYTNTPSRIIFARGRSNLVLTEYMRSIRK